MRYIDPPDGRPWALLVLCGSSLLLNVYLLASVASAPESEQAPVVAQTEVVSEAAVAEVVDPAEEVDVEVEIVVDAPTAALPDGIDRISADIEHSLARTFQNADSERGDVVSAVFARLFVWDLDLRRDLQRGDHVEVAYEWDGELAHVVAASYASGKLGRTITGYRYQADGDSHPSWWDETGQELPHRLVNGPLAGNYEQITSLLKDRPRHRGMDFKVPEGTPVVSPKNGNVTRANWNVANNGNCVEVRYDDGHTARFLHLSETSVKSGQRVSAGSAIGLSGNTGRSTAPHLHYEIDKAGTVIDPVKYHGTIRRSLKAADLADFEATTSRLEPMLQRDS